MATFYKVGGAVRDELLGLTAKDTDYAVEADSFDSLRAAILERGGEIFLETPQYFTIRAKVPTLGACDYVLCRRDGPYKDGRRPETVEVGTIYDDLARRDFTVNAMARTEEGDLIDPHNGLKHLMEKHLRCVGDAKTRFTEDGLRMLRAIRFEITKGLIMDDDIVRCLSKRDFFTPRLVGVSSERIREELLKCFKHNTRETLLTLSEFESFSDYIFNYTGIWLKPTTEAR